MKKNQRQQNLEVLLGISIVPKNLMLTLHLAKGAKDLANYKAKKVEIKKRLYGVLKGSALYNELKSTSDAIKTKAIELRIDYISLEKDKSFTYEDNCDQLLKKTEKRQQEIETAFIKKHNLDKNYGILTELVYNYKKTSIAHNIRL